MNVLITGTSKGIGRALVEAYLESGWNVYAVSRSQEPVSRVEDIYMTKYRHFAFDWKDIDAFVRQLSYTLDGQAFDVLINNAGVLHIDMLLDVSLEDMRAHFEVNALYPLILSRALIREKLLGRGSHIVNIGSMAGYQGASKYPGLGAYAMSKGALSTLTEVMAAEWSGMGITVNCLCPGAVETEMLKQAFPGLNGAVKASQMAIFIREFAVSGRGIINGKIIPVSVSDPEA